MLPGVKLQEIDQPTQPLTGVSSQSLSVRAISLLDIYTRGHAAEVVRVCSFVFSGGLAALVNLFCVWMFARYTSLPHALYIILATEISLLCSFVLNDRLTFRSMIDGRRKWWLRCLRFHGPAAIGFAFTLLVSDAVYYLWHLPSLISQAIALILATALNFVMHCFWTYRRPSHYGSAA